MRKPNILSALLAASGPVFMDVQSIEDLREKLVDLHTQANTIQAQADKDGRELTTDEETSINEIFGEFDRIEADIARRERLEMQASRMSTPQPRQTPADLRRTAEADNSTGSSVPRIQVREGFERDKKRWGWGSMGEMALAVRTATAPGQMNIDPRLAIRMEDPGTYGNEQIGADGGFAVPPEFRTEIMQKVNAENQIISLTDQYTSARNAMVFPLDESTPWQTSGGIQAYWEGEAKQMAKSKPALDNTSIRLNKLTALVPVSDETLEDAPMMDSYLRQKTPEKMSFKINMGIVQGTGSGQPLGILNSGSLVTVAKEASQAADTVVPQNIAKMYARMYSGSLGSSVWLVNQDILPQLLTMVIEGSSGGVFPVYQPPTGFAGAPFGTILGRPLFFTEATETLGDKGDIIFADLRQYLTAQKVGGPRVDVSMHIYFDYGATAFRFVIRVAGQPWWNAPISRRQSGNTNTLSPFVTLAARA